MTRATLLHVLERPTDLGPDDVRELERLAQAFPYCQTAHLLLAKAAHDQGTMLAGQRLRRAATYAADRTLLRRLIEQTEPVAVPAPLPAPPHPLDLVDWPDAYVPPAADALVAPAPVAVAVPPPVENFQPAAPPIVAGPEAVEAPVARAEVAVPAVAPPSLAAVVAMPEPAPATLPDIAPPAPAAADQAADRIDSPAALPEAVIPEPAPVAEAPVAAAPTAPEAAETAALPAAAEAPLPAVVEPAAIAIAPVMAAAPEPIASEPATAVVIEIPASVETQALSVEAPAIIEEILLPIERLADPLPAAPTTAEAPRATPAVEAVLVPETELPEVELPPQAPAIRPPAEAGEARFEFGLADPAPVVAVATYELPGLVDEWAASAVTRGLGSPEALVAALAAPPAPVFTPAAFTGDATVGYAFGESSRLGFSMQLLDLLTAKAETAEAATAVVAAAQPAASPLPPPGTFFEPDPLLLDHWATHRPAAPEVPSTLDLINNFLKRQPRLSRPAMLPPTPTPQADLSVRSTRAEPDLVSENLARIFVRQGKTARAIEIYEKLMVKQPEKMAYFAAQIQTLQPSA